MKGLSLRQRSWEDVSEGEKLPTLELAVPYRRVVINAAATRDFFAGHHDPEYARGQGLPTIYVSNLFFQAFVDRLVTDWGGPATFIARRKITNRVPLFAGDSAIGEAQVVRRYEEGDRRRLVEIEFAVRNQEGTVCADGTVVAALPGRWDR
jgi:acyl dehydratase